MRNYKKTTERSKLFTAFFEKMIVFNGIIIQNITK